MKIIEKGRRPAPTWLGRWRCDGCGTVVELDETDRTKAMRQGLCDLDGDAFECLTGAFCPVCKSLIGTWRRADS